LPPEGYPLRGDLSPPNHMTVPKDIIRQGAGADTVICSEVRACRPLRLAAYHCVSAGPLPNDIFRHCHMIRRRSLFEHIISTEKDFYKSCTISDKWLDYPVFAENVRLAAYHCVSAGPLPNDIFRHCHMIRRREVAAKRGTFRGQKILASIMTAQREFSYPIFDVDYRTAFVCVPPAPSRCISLCQRRPLAE
jgi:hypothetical protein